MRTQTERACALLIQSGLPRFLWEEAMKHTTWLQNRTPARALDSQTPYEAINKRKPYLGGIQEFGVAVYVKDMNAGKLNTRAQIGRFVRYDAESKGYRIYWPRKQSITVERNVVFNENDTRTSKNFTINSGDMSDKGERDKIIQQPTNNVENVEEPEETENQTVNDNHINKEPAKDHQNTIQFPPSPKKPDSNDTNESDSQQEEDPEPQIYGQGQ